jgi:WD40 repeat protein
MSSYSTLESDEVINCIDSTAGGVVAIGVFRAYSTCSVYVYDHTGVLSHRLQHNFPISGLKISPSDPSILVTVSDQVRIWNITSGHLVSVLSHFEQDPPELCPYTSVSFAPEGNVFCTTDVNGCCSIWDVAKKAPIEVFSLGSERLYDSSFIVNSVIACLGETGSLYTIDRDSHQVVCAHGEAVQPRCQPTKLAWIPGLSLVAVGYQTSGIVCIYEMNALDEAPKLIGSSKSTNDPIADMCWIKSNPQYLLVARDSGTIEVWNRNNLISPHYTYKAPHPVSAVCFNYGTVLVGDVTGHTVASQLPSRMEEGGVTTFSVSRSKERGRGSSYPALA